MRRFIALIAAAVIALPAFAAGKPASFEAGKQYKRIAKPMPPPDGNRVTVQEFFWYGCSHCYDFEPALTAWLKKKPAWVRFERMPNSLGRPVGELHQRVFYTADLLGIEDRIHAPFMAGLHQGDASLNTLEGARALFQKVAGTDPKKFDGLAQSFVVDGKIRQANQLAIDYLVMSTPTVIVDGKYATDNSMAGGFEQAVKVVDFLVEKARAERQLKK